MKRIILLIFCLGIMLDVCLAQFDVNAFWEKKQSENKEFVKYTTDNGKLKRKCQQVIADVHAEESADASKIPMDSVEKNIVQELNRLLIGDKRLLYRCFVKDDPYPNAWVNSSGYVFLSSSLMNMLDHEELIGVIAHEVAHHKLMHVEINFYAQKKKERKNKIWAGVLTGVTSAMNTAGAVMSSSAGIQQDWNQVTQTNIQMGNAIYGDLSKNAEMWGYKYSREQELEADLIAAELMDSVRIGRKKIISAFEKLRQNDRSMGINTSVTKKKSDHPSWDERINAVTKAGLKNDDEKRL